MGVGVWGVGGSPESICLKITLRTEEQKQIIESFKL